MLASNERVKLTAEQDIADKIAAARARLVVVEPQANSLSALGAAALAATAAVLMACVMVIGPGVHFEDATSTYQP